MRSFKFTIRTRFFLLITLVAVGGILCMLFYFEGIHRMENASRLKLDILQIQKNYSRIHSVLPEWGKPAEAASFLSNTPADTNELFSIIADLPRLTDQLLQQADISRNKKVIRSVQDFRRAFLPYKRSLMAVYNDYSERNSLLLLLRDQQKSLESISISANIQELSAFYNQYRDAFTAWMNSGDAYRLAQMTSLSRDFVTRLESGRIASGYSQNDNLKKFFSDNWLTLQRLSTIQGHLSPLDQNGVLQDYTDNYELSSAELLKLLRIIVEYDKSSATYALHSVFFVVGLFVFFLIYYLLLFATNLRNSLEGTRHFLSTLVSGQIPESIPLKGHDEFTDMAASLDTFTNDLQQKARFATGIGQGNLDAAYTPLSDEDLLGNALIGLQKNLQEAQKSQQEHETEEQKRRWINEGLTKFAEILRLNNNNIDALSDQIIQNTVVYLEANQGGLFLLDETNADEPVLELVSCFAYNRKKYLTESIKLGEGLIGTCAIEKEPILISDVPDEYLTITSGLGESNPRCIVLVPLKLEEKVLGVIEIASFRIIENHQLEFLEKVAESIASTIATVRINMRTESLLEQSQHQSRVLAEQEEEMRQNMEELQATQEESKRREAEISGILSAIHLSSLVLEFDMLERIVTANEKFCALVEISPEHLKGKKYSTLFSVDPTTEIYSHLWDNLKMGIDQARVECIKTAAGKQTWVSMNLTPIRQHDNKIIKVLCIAHDITESKIQEQSIQKQSKELARKNQELESLNQAVDNALLKCAYDMNASIIDANDNFLKLTGYNLKEIVSKDSRQFIKPDEQVQFDKIWAEVTKDKSYTGVIKRTKPTGEELWLMSSYTPVKDEKGNIYKVYYLGQDITERKLKYKLLEEANKEIERLKAQLGGR